MAGYSVFAELRKRKIFRAAAIYGAVAWGLTEVIVTIVEQLYMPAWVATLTVIVFVVGFPVAMFLAWTFDITSHGIQRTAIGSRRGAMSIAGSTLLLIAGTAGLFLLIRPGMEQVDRNSLDTLLMPNSIAVLPFENISRREADYYLSEGLSDELRDQLSRVPGIQIAARSSSVAVRNQAFDALRMASTLGVSYLIEGSLRRSGPKLGISVQLIDGRTGIAAWSNHYERGRLELLDVQADIAREVVRVVLPHSPGIQVAAPATLNASANDVMLLARHKDNEVRSRQIVDTEKLLEAIGLYRQAAEIDPHSALIHSRLASALLYLGDLEEAGTSILRALELDPDLSEVQNTLGEYYWALGEPAAMTAFEKAVELDPYNVDALNNLAMKKWISMPDGTGDSDAEELLRRALENDRMSLMRHAALGQYVGFMGQWDEVPTIIDNIEKRFDSAESYRAIAWLHEIIGEIDLAIGWTLRARDREPDNPDHLAKLADLYAMLGDAETALRLQPSPSLSVLRHLRRHRELIDEAELLMIDRPDDVAVRYMLAFSYVATGAFDSAIRVLSSTGQPDIVLNDQARTGEDGEAFVTLLNALAGSGLPESIQLARSLTLWRERTGYKGEVGWIAENRGCGLAILGRHEAALDLLPDVKKSRRLRDSAVLHDSWCFQQYADEPVYQDILADQASRREALRRRLPETLAELGVAL